MCGILGFLATADSGITRTKALSAVSHLLVLSESRGKEAAGVATIVSEKIQVYKQPTSASNMIRTRQFQDLFSSKCVAQNLKSTITILGHSRLVTTGGMCDNDNNQPVIAAGMVCIHNGIIVNVEALWRCHSDMKRGSGVDTEILPCLIRKYYEETHSLDGATRRTFAEIEGVANIAVIFQDINQLLLATNNGSIYYAENEKRSLFLFCSEKHIMKEVLRKTGLERFSGPITIRQLRSGRAVLIHLETLVKQPFILTGAETQEVVPEKLIVQRQLVEVKGPSVSPRAFTVLAPESGVAAPQWFLEECAKNAQIISHIRRCRKCVHPETLPYAHLDEDGVCSYCRNHEMLRFKGHDALMELIEPYRRENGMADCIVPLSGGRDSVFALHYIKNILGLHPVAYTYDWGMVTDLARRNCSRVCGKLGVEHIIISADIARKRDYIRKNVQAWMHKPDLGTIPLFMAGDKQFFYHAERIKKQLGIDLLIFSMNPLERTDFKHGFCGISGGGTQDSFFRLSLMKNLQIATYYAKAYLSNPKYLNASLLDTLFAYFAYYVMPHKYEMLYDYIEWNEDIVSSTILREYNWEMSPDTRSTWRIGDGTASFYNYIYWTVAGFSENDTFRSYQVRQNVLSRDKALELLKEENRPRYESMAWYCATVGLDLEECIRVINHIPKLYAVSS